MIRSTAPFLSLVLLASCSTPPSTTSDASADSGADLVDTGPPDSGVREPFTVTVLDRARITSQGDQPNFHRVSGELDLGPGPFARVRLVGQLETTCFPFEQWLTERPPAGMNYPPSCDAFDRNFEITIDPPRAMGDPLGFEVIHAITPFGGPMTVEADLTDLANAHPGAHRIGVVIPTYSDGAGRISGSNGGWNVTVRVEVEPGTPPRNVLAVVPLVDVNHTRDTTTADVPFTVPAGATRGRIEYRTTGHGGGMDPAPTCIGPAEEFCQRVHEVRIDGALQAQQWSPWRTCTDNCTIARSTVVNRDYCMQNPTADPRSAVAPRANWCPGNVTEPRVFEPASLGAPGAHTFRYDIRDVFAGGSWRVSAIAYFYGD